jgi:hypothetical protein
LNGSTLPTPQQMTSYESWKRYGQFKAAHARSQSAALNRKACGDSPTLSQC